MKLDPAGTEYAHIPTPEGVPANADPLEVSFDDGATWHPTTWNTDKTEATVLVSGPQGTGGGVTLPEGHVYVLARLVDTPERIIREVPGRIEVSSA